MRFPPSVLVCLLVYFFKPFLAVMLLRFHECSFPVISRRHNLSSLPGPPAFNSVSTISSMILSEPWCSSSVVDVPTVADHPHLSCSLHLTSCSCVGNPGKNYDLWTGTSVFWRDWNTSCPELIT